MLRCLKRNKPIGISFFCSVLLSTASFGAHAAPSLEDRNFVDLIQDHTRLEEDARGLESLADDLWKKFAHDAQGLAKIKGEHAARALNYKDKTMKFSMEKRGAASEHGVPLYIALHGGGTAPAYVNDSQWEHMKIYYRDSVNQGVYVAARGVSDTWNLHFMDESYALYDRLIENMVLYEGVDPNRVYFLGFSAGGDGVYQVVPRMPDRFAAANMSAGHHNWISFDNLYNTPFLLQMGEKDAAYKRNTVAAENHLKLNALNAQYGGGFTHDLFLHVGGSHNSWRDNDSSRRLSSVIANPEGWLQLGVRDAKQVNSNAIDWLNQFSRNPVPERLVWDLTTGAPRTQGAGSQLLTSQGGQAAALATQNQLFYWLDVSVASEFPSQGKIVANVDRNHNVVHVEEVKNVKTFRILLNTHMLDLAKPVAVVVGDQSIASLTLTPNLKTMTRTLLERSDKNFIFEAEVTLKYNDDAKIWEVVHA